MPRKQHAHRRVRASKQIVPVANELAALAQMTVSELQEKHRETIGEPSRSRNREYLVRQLAWRIQEDAEGGLSNRAMARIDILAEDAPVRWRPRQSAKSEPAAPASDDGRDPRLPSVGELVSREYNGVNHEARVLDDGFEYGGATYRTLSAIAKKITGKQWNGFLFFGLASRKRPDKQKVA